jgi:hypothetical protein
MTLHHRALVRFPHHTKNRQKLETLHDNASLLLALLKISFVLFRA